jgi:hypothetical protein
MSPERSETSSIETGLRREAVLDALADGTRVHEWAPAFADSAIPDGDGGDGWRGTKDGSEFRFRLAVQREAGTADFLRTAPSGEENGAYVRVTPRLGGGSVIAMTLPVRPGMTLDGVREVLAAELAAIERMAAS